MMFLARLLSWDSNSPCLTPILLSISPWVWYNTERGGYHSQISSSASSFTTHSFHSKDVDCHWNLFQLFFCQSIWLFKVGGAGREFGWIFLAHTYYTRAHVLCLWFSVEVNYTYMNMAFNVFLSCICFGLLSLVLQERYISNGRLG